MMILPRPSTSKTFLEICQTALNQKQSFDGRWIVVISLGIYFATLGIAHHFGRYYEVGTALGYNPCGIAFEDLENITSAVQAARAGYDPLVNDIYDPLHRAMSYPRIWIAVLSPFNVTMKNDIGLGVGLALLFYGTFLLFIGRLNAAEGLVYSALICLPPVMLGENRGSNDLFTFVLMLFGLMIPSSSPSSWFSYVLVFFAALLKYYPISALALAMRERKKPAIMTVALGSAGFLVYLLLTRDDIKKISKSVSRDFSNTYGRRVMFNYFDMIRHRQPLPVSDFWLSMLLLAVVTTAAVIVYLRYFRGKELFAIYDGLVTGSALYVSTFLFHTNYSYRMVVVLMTIPALLKLVKQGGSYGYLSLFALVTILVAFLFAPSLIMSEFLVKEAADWLLYALFLIFLMSSFQVWNEQSTLDLKPRIGNNIVRLPG